MSHNNCPICLDSLCSSSAKRIGVATPCGHCFHRPCFQKWAESSTSQSLRITNGTEFRTKCPTCNTLVTEFVGIYLNFSSIGSTNGDEGSNTVDVIDVDNGGTVVSNQNLGNEQNACKQLLEKHAQEIITLKTQVNSLKDKLQNAKMQIADLEGKKGLMKLRLEATIRDNCRTQRLVSALESKVREVGIEKQKITRELAEFEQEYEREILKARTNSMAEVNEITERSKTVSDRYDALVKHFRTQELKIEAMQKQEAHMMRLMTQNAETELEASRKKGNMRSIRQPMKAKQYADARRHVELEQEAEAKEAIAVRKRSQARAMMKSSSTQASRVFKAARISAKIQKGVSAKVPRSLSVSSHESNVKNTYSDGNNTTSDEVISNLHFSGKRSVNAILPRTSPSRRFVQGKPQRKKDERTSHRITKWLS